MAEEKNNRSEKLETLDHQIRDIINQWNEDPAQISDFLQFASKFSYSYSPRNTMLIQQQQSGAILCKSFQGWKELGYSVKRGEHGMEVYVPTPITLLKIADTEIPYSKASKEQQAAYDAGNLEGRKIIHFKVGYTFDIAQTNFPPEHYPKFLDRGIPSELHKQCTEVLKEFCEETLGVRVFLQDQDQEIKGAALYGFHSPGTSEIHIASTLQDTAAFSTLTHEVGHALAHGTLDEFFNIGSHQKEFEADVMSIMLRQHYGLEITDERKSHLVGHYKSWLESDPKNFAPDKSIKKMFDLYSSQVKLLDQKMIQKFPELAQKLLAPEIEPNPEAKLQKQITRKSIPKKKKTLRR